MQAILKCVQKRLDSFDLLNEEDYNIANAPVAGMKSAGSDIKSRG